MFVLPVGIQHSQCPCPLSTTTGVRADSSIPSSINRKMQVYHKTTPQQIFYSIVLVWGTKAEYQYVVCRQCNAMSVFFTCIPGIIVLLIIVLLYWIRQVSHTHSMKEKKDRVHFVSRFIDPVHTRTYQVEDMGNTQNWETCACTNAAVLRRTRYRSDPLQVCPLLTRDNFTFLVEACSSFPSYRAQQQYTHQYQYIHTGNPI